MALDQKERPLMSYEYLQGLGAEDDDTFVLGVKVGGSEKRSQRSGRRPQEGKRQQPQYSREERRRRTQAACGGAGCPEGLGAKIFREIDNPLRLAEFQDEMEGRGCSLLCSVGNSAAYCCPSASRPQEVVTDPFATDPTMLESVATSIAARPEEQLPEGAHSDEQNGRSQLGLVVALGIVGFGAAGVIGYLVFRPKRKRKKRKKGKS